jgi:hypothetical protein
MHCERATLVGLMLCASCGEGRVGARTGEAPAAPESVTEMNVYRGDGFRIAYPVEAHIDTLAPNAEYGRRVAIVGEDVHVIAALWPRGEDTVGRSGPSYMVTIDEIPNVNRRPLRSVVDSMISRRGPRPPNGDDTPRLDSVRVGGERGYLLTIPCGDCDMLEVYVEHSGRVARIAWHADASDVFAGATRPLFWYLVSGFRWE